MPGIEQLVERCITRAYDPQFIVDVFRETYALGIRYEPDKREAATKEYGDLLEEFSRLRDRPLNGLQTPVPIRTGDKLNLEFWSASINASYEKLGKDVLYEPRTVLKNLGNFIRRYKCKFSFLERMMGSIEKHQVAHWISNNTPELTDKEMRRRVDLWQEQLPAAAQGIYKKEDIADIAYLGSKAMADAFCMYFDQQCLSGSLGEAAILPGGFVGQSEAEAPDVDTFFCFLRISERVLNRYLLHTARASDGGTNDPSFWEKALQKLGETKHTLDGKSISQETRACIDFLHEELKNYVHALGSLDTSVLRMEGKTNFPFASQLDAVYLLRSEKRLIHSDDNEVSKNGDGRAIFADEMGCGKTLPAIHADALYRKERKVKKTLVVCPNQMKGVWKERFTEYLTDKTLKKYYGFADGDGQQQKSHVCLVEGSRSLKDIQESSVVIVNYEMLHRALRYKENSEKEILTHAHKALENGVEEIFKDDESLLARISSEADKMTHALGRARKEFRGKERILEWIGDNERRAQYALSTQQILEDEAEAQTSLFSYGADFLILDEAHAVKNDLAKRTKAIERLAETIPKIALLTGTLIPNRYDDIDMPLKLVDRTYAQQRDGTDKECTLEPKIRRIRQALIPYLSRNKRDDVQPRSYALTAEQGRIDVVESDIVMRTVYRAIIEDTSMTFADKARLARLTTLHPALALNKLRQLSNDYEHIENLVQELMSTIEQRDGSSARALEDGTYIPPKYKKIADVVRTHEGNVVVFTSHIEGNTRELEDSFIPVKTMTDYLREIFGNENVLVHDGETKKGERKTLLDTFNYCPERKIILASYPTLGEGEDLTRGSLALCVDLPYALPDQAVGRLDRLSQRHDVTVKYLTVTDGRLSSGTKSGLTIDEAVLELGKDKKIVSGIIVDGRPPTEQELEAYRRLKTMQGENVETYTPLKDGLQLYDPDKEKFEKDRERLQLFLQQTRQPGRDSSTNVKGFDESLRLVYIVNSVLVPTSYTATSNRALAALVQGASARRHVDVGGGPASLALAGELRSQYTIIDPTPWENDVRQVLEKRGMMMPLVTFVQDYFQKFKSGEPYDIVTCNNVLHWTSSLARRGRTSEREDFMRSINENLVDGGIFILGMPGLYSDKGRKNLEDLLSHTGFTIKRSGDVCSQDDATFHELFVVAQKSGAPRDVPFDSSKLNFHIKSGTVKKPIGTRKNGKVSHGDTSKPGNEARTFLFYNFKKDTLEAMNGDKKEGTQ